MTSMQCRARMACAALLLSCAASASAVEAACDGPDAVVLHPAAQATADARAYWLDAGSLRWPGKPVDGRYRLLASADAALRTSPGTVASGIDEALALAPAGALAADIEARFRFTGPGVELQVPAQDLPAHVESFWAIMRSGAKPQPPRLVRVSAR